MHQRDYNTPVEKGEGGKVPQEVNALSFYIAFQQVTDGRKKRGVHDSLPFILTPIRLGQVGRSQGYERHRSLGSSESRPTEPGVAAGVQAGFPYAATFGNVLRSLDAQQCLG